MGDSETDRRPNLTMERADTLLKQLYGFTDVTTVQLNGYFDKNYHVQVNKTSNEEELWPHGYVLKVINSLDSKNINYIDAQTEMAKYLGKNGVTSPQPVKNLAGKYYSLEELQDDATTTKHLIRLLTYQSGQLLVNVPCTNEVLYKIGKLVGTVGKTLKGFRHSAYDSEKPVWSLESTPQLRNIIDVIDDNQKRALVITVLDTFDKEVVDNMDSLEKGLLHGDINEQNVLMSKTNDESWDVCAILDLGDSHWSCFVFELAVNIAHMVLLSPDPISAGGHIIAGYNTMRILPEKEMKLLKVCVCARLCMLLVMGAYCYKKDSQNEYLLSWTKRDGWNILNLLWHTPYNEISDKWRNITLSYLT